MTTTSRLRLTGLAAAGVLALAACGSVDSPEESASSSAGAASSAAASGLSSAPSDARTSPSDDASAEAEGGAPSSAGPSVTGADAAFAEVLAAARAHLAEAESVRVEADVAPGGGPTSVEVHGLADGSAARGTLGGSDEEFTGSMGFLHVDGDTWITMDGESAPGGDPALGMVDGRWMAAPAGAVPVEQLLPDALLDAADDALAGMVDADGVTSEAITRDGEPMRRYTDGTGWSLVVDEQGRLRALEEDGGAQGMRFEDWDEAPAVQAPGPEELVTLEDLKADVAGSASSASGR